jgi:hypothetical protein
MLWCWEIETKLDELLLGQKYIIELLKPKPVPRTAHGIRFTIKADSFTFSGGNMTFSMLATQTVSVIGSPVQADGVTPSAATLSNTTYTSSDSTIFTVAADPATPNGAIITGVAAGTATLTETATATEPDGTTTEQIQGVATIVLTTAPPPPPPPAASLVFTFGTPTP